jgi:protein-L-isoaspartate O-methyltransferase
MTETYRARTYVPPLAQRLGFTRSSTPHVGRLLRTLVASVRDGRIGEMGTGRGYGTAWMASALSAHGNLVTVENDAERAAAAAHRFAELPNVRVLHDDSSALLAHGPFDLIFVDGGGGVKATPDSGGLPDPTRALWLNDPRVAAMELIVDPSAGRQSAVIVASYTGLEA